jgi:hypothetical protein
MFASAKKRFDHLAQERFAQPAEAQAGQRDTKLGCREVGV